MYLPDQKLVVAVDNLIATGDKIARFEQFWHLAPSTKITPCSGGFLALQAEQHRYLSIAVDESSDDTWDQWEGRQDQPIGWAMTDWNQLTPNSVLCRMFSAQRRWCVTAFRLTSFAEPSVWVEYVTQIDGGAVAALRTPDTAIRLSAQEDGNMQLERS